MIASSLSLHLPVLQVVVPLIGAPLCALLPRARSAWWLSLVVSAIALVIAQALFMQVLEQGPLRYAPGGWAAPWGIEYRIDFSNAIVLLVVSAVSFLGLLFARDSIEREVPRERVFLFYTAWLLSLTGLLGMSATGDAFNVFVFLEISSLSGYTLVSLGRERAALGAAFRYLILGTIGGTFFLIGVGFLYSLTGTLNMLDLGHRLPELADNRTAQMAYAFITIGLGLKAAMFPLHAWLPAAYAKAPVAATVFLAGSATKVALYVWLRFTFDLFGIEFVFQALGAGMLLGALAIVGAVAGSLAAVYHRDVKMVLAYSSVAQVGYMILAMSLANESGLTASLAHIFNHALIKSALFIAVGCVVFRVGVSDSVAFKGIGRRMPFTMVAFSLAGLSLIGVPFTAGFVSKWMLLQALFESGAGLLAVLIAGTSLLAVIYVGKVVELAFFQAPSPSSMTDRAREAPILMQAALWILVLANLYFGLDTSVTIDAAGEAARALLQAPHLATPVDAMPEWRGR